MVDYCIAGAGLSGMVLAERLTAAGKSVLIVERRNHIGGNCYDAHDANGVLYHVYGPHYFRTGQPGVRAYLSRFTGWLPASYRVKAMARGRLWSFPVNLATFEELVGHPASPREFAAWIEEHRVPVREPANSEEVILSKVGRDLYELFFEGYSLKQWKRHPRDLDPSICARIPIRLEYDDRYFSDPFQAMPEQGYTAMFERMLEACGDRAEIIYGVDFLKERKRLRFRHLIYTGPLDEYFGFSEGELPWRSLRFEPRSYTARDLAGRLPYAGRAGFWQPVVQVNYTDDHAYTRTVEAKHVTGQDTPHTNVMFEYPADFSRGAEPYYPVPGRESAMLAERYAGLAAQERDTVFLGRLAQYQYLNMDQVVHNALECFKTMMGTALSDKAAAFTTMATRAAVHRMPG